MADKPKAGGAILITDNYALTLIKCTSVPPLVANEWLYEMWRQLRTKVKLKHRPSKRKKGRDF